MAWRIPVGGRTAAQHARQWWQEHGWKPGDGAEERASARLQVAQPGDEPAAPVTPSPVEAAAQGPVTEGAVRPAGSERESVVPAQARAARREPRPATLRERITDEDRRTIERLMR